MLTVPEWEREKEYMRQERYGSRQPELGAERLYL